MNFNFSFINFSYTTDGPIKGDYGIVGLMEKGNPKALFALHYESQNCKIKRLQVSIIY